MKNRYFGAGLAIIAVVALWGPVQYAVAEPPPTDDVFTPLPLSKFDWGGPGNGGPTHDALFCPLQTVTDSRIMLVNRGAVCSAPLCGSYSLGFEWQPVWPPLDEYKEVLTVSLGGTQKPTWSYDFVSGVSIQFSADDQKIFVRDMFLNQGLGSADVTIDNGSEYRVAIDVEVDALGDRNLEVYFAPKSEEFGAAKISVSLAGIATGNDQITVINRESVALVTHISTLTKVILCEGGQSSSSTSSASSDPEAPPEPIDSSSSMPMMEAPVPEEGSASSMGNPSMPESDEGASSSANSSM